MSGRVRGPLGVVAVVLAVGGVIALARGPGYPKVLLPGPCQVVESLEYPGDMPPVTERRTFAYDERGNKIEEQRRVGDQVMTTTRWEYDDRGNALVETRIEHGPIHRTESDGTTRVIEDDTSTVRKTYDEAGRVLTREYFRDAETETPHRTVFSYDEAGRKIGAHATWEGKYESDTEFEYDEAGNLVVERDVGSAMGTTRYEYDEAGRVVRETYQVRQRGGPDRVIVRVYDDEGREVRTETDEGGAERRVLTRTFDDYGNLVESVEVAEGSDGSGVTVTQTHDYSCWTRQGDDIVAQP